MTTGPLDGLRVLDLSNQLSGPYCAMLLGDLGADVVKVEHPVGGDPARLAAPHLAGESARCGAARRAGSPPTGCSTLTTSAPRSPSSIAQYGPESWFERSRTRRPSSGPVVIVERVYRALP